MINYEYIMFDLDGTLTDPAIGITNSIIYALNKYDINVTDRSELFKFIGPPLWESFRKYYGFSNKKANEAVEFYREYYKEIGIFENLVFEGIENLLKMLQENSRTLIVATSKPEVYAKQILEHFEISKYFTLISGGNLDGTKANKDEIISYVLEKCNIIDKSRVIMIGDREHDIIGAKKNCIHSMGVLFGYGDREELEKAGADYIVKTVSEIGRILISK